MSKFCRSAVGLAKLWRALESKSSQTELNKIVRIDSDGKQVPWKQFFFPPENIHEFAASVENGSVQHPIALLLHVKNVYKESQGKIRVDFTAMKDSSTSFDTRISIQVYGSNEIISKFYQNNYYTVFGNYQKRKENQFPREGLALILYKNFALDVYQEAQFEQVDISVAAQLPLRTGVCGAVREAA